MLRIENPIINNIAIMYLGLSLDGKKYGLQMLPSCDSKLTMAVAQARFSGVWFKTLAAHEYTIELAAKAPEQYKNAAKYLAGTLSVATEIAKPMTATNMGTEMW